MWKLESEIKGYSLYKDGKKMGELFGFYGECMEIVSLLNNAEVAQQSVQRTGGMCPNCRRPVQSVEYCEACGPVTTSR